MAVEETRSFHISVGEVEDDAFFTDSGEAEDDAFYRDASDAQEDAFVTSSSLISANATGSSYINALKQRVENLLARKICISESLYINAVKQMKEVEQHNFALERQLVASVHALQEVEEKLISAQVISTILRKQLDEIQLERDNALREAEELRNGNTLVTEEVKMQIDNVTQELQATRKQIFLLQRQLADSDRMVKELQDKNDSVLELLTMSKKERDVIQLERDNALREAEKLRKGNTIGTEEVKMRIDNLTEELRAARKQIFPLRRKLADSDRMVKELEDKKDSALELLAISKKDQDVIQLERDNALREAAELRKGNTLVTEEVKMQKDNVTKELRAARKQIFPLRRKLADYDRMVKELEDKNESALELLAISKKDQDVIQLERDDALREAEKLRKGNTLVTEELKMQKDNVTKELRAGRKQISALRRQLADSDRIVKELEDKNDSTLELLTISKKEQALIQLERDNALRETEELRKGNTLVTEEVKMQKDNVTKELRAAMKQMSALRRQLADSDGIVKELKDNTLELLTISKNERDKIQLERDNAIREAEELRQGIEDVTANLQMMQFFSVFSLMEIEKATHGFDPWLIIGRGGYGNVFRGTLRNIDVAIKRLHQNSSQGRSEFQKEVDVLSRVRHPNLVTLIGTCPEDCALIYEYLPNGSLEDRLAWEKNKTLPLSWQTRTRIAAEICSALIFLHSNKPHIIVHGDLKPANVLLDANLVSKLGDFGICRLVRCDGNTTPLCETTPKGTLGYMDPEFFSTGELTPKSDVFAFGIVLLQLLTRRPAMGLINEVQSALRKGSISAALDASAGEWPLAQANELARLALWCCEMNRRNRPDLVSEVWRVLEPLKASYGDSSLS